MRFIPRYVERRDLLRAYIFEGEHEKQDFKRFISSVEKIAKTICAFANAEGGRLLIGVDDQGNTHHVDVEEEMFMVHEAATEYCRPPVDISFIVHVDGDTEVLEVDIVKGAAPPYYAKDEKGNWKMYKREGDKVVAK